MLYRASYDFHMAMSRLSRAQVLPYDVQPISPSSLDDLNASHTSQLIILGEYSHNIIFGEQSLNHLQRAWHDTIHLRLQADTSMAGEYRVARQQCLELERVSGTTLANILWCDIYGQTLYYAQFESFPTAQAQFTWQYYTTGVIAQQEGA